MALGDVNAIPAHGIGVGRDLPWAAWRFYSQIRPREMSAHHDMKRWGTLNTTHANGAVPHIMTSAVLVCGGIVCLRGLIRIEEVAGAEAVEAL